jgi:peptidoglycan/xylan/chitin deacetylase (PgdA/CDA1 family)
MKRLTVTFDNGPDPVATPLALDALKQRDVRATFFVCGQGNTLHPARKAGTDAARRILERAREEGHWIGNHTLSHTLELGTTRDRAKIEREIGGNDEILGDLNSERLFRPYMGGGIVGPRNYSPEAVAYLCENGYSSVMFNCVADDWVDGDAWPEIALAKMGAQDWTLLIVHDVDRIGGSRYGGMNHLGAFLDEAIARGVEIVQEFPDECVPIRKGEVGGSLDGLVCDDAFEPLPQSTAALDFME